MEIINDQIQADGLSIKQWIETDENILKRTLKLKDVYSSIEILEYLIGEVHQIRDSINWDYFKFITITGMEEVLAGDTLGVSKEIELALKEYQLNEQAYKVEKAESFSNIGFLQAEYDTERGDDYKEHLGFQLGISLPVFNADKPDLQREKLDLLAAENNIAETEEQVIQERLTLKTKFINCVWSYQLVTEKLSKLESFGKDISYDRLDDFLALVEYIGNLKVLRNEIYLDCLNTYIDLLALNGRLSKAPYVNFISEELTPFSFVE